MAKSTSKLFKEETPKNMKEDAMNLPAEVASDTFEDVQDIDLRVTAKKRFRINGDNNKILYLNTSDLSISSRLSTSYNRLTKYVDEVGNVIASLPDDVDDISEDDEKVIDDQLSAIDEKMRQELDFIFDAPVSDICGEGGKMYDPFEGAFRFEHIIEALAKLYETNLSYEFSKMKRRINAKTSKYTKKYHN